MRRRRWAALIGLVAVLLHGAAFIYHNAAMLSAYAAHKQLLSDLTVLCHGGEGPNEVEAPTLPLPSEQSSGCLICNGLISAVAILTTPAGPEPTTYAIAMPPPVPRLQWRGHRATNLPPPARGPPV
jgi:hypothetical protein